MEKEKDNDLQRAREFMDSFAEMTGLYGSESKTYNRYLWTDAYAVQTFFGLAHIYKDPQNQQTGLKLIHFVHQRLGRFTYADSRRGWISGLAEEQGREHPTAGGLRIGKSLPERSESEALNERLEWERDGQYFHYNTRWIQALMKAAEETGRTEFRNWAAELLLASRKFVSRNHGHRRMYWKMSIDLSRPLVNSMGAHDPLEGLILAETLKHTVPELAPQLGKLSSEFEDLSQEMDWKTNDTLGIGGLLLNAVRAAELAKERSVPEAMDPEKLLNDCRYGLSHLMDSKELTFTAARRLAFRECGLSLALRVLFGRQSLFEKQNIDLRPFEEFLPLAEEIEEFWLKPKNQDSVLWKKHLNINTVSLAASIVARQAPGKF